MNWILISDALPQTYPQTACWDASDRVFVTDGRIIWIAALQHLANRIPTVKDFCSEGGDYGSIKAWSKIPKVNMGIIYLTISRRRDTLYPESEATMSRSTISTFQLFEKFPNEASAYAYVEKRLWPNGPVCPRCKDVESISKREKGRAGNRITYAQLTKGKTWFDAEESNATV